MKANYLVVLSVCLWAIMGSCGGKATSNKRSSSDSIPRTESQDVVQKEAAKFSAEDMVGVWDYYAESDPSNKIEIVFKKDGTLIDYIDFHSTGTYKVNPEGTMVTMQFFYKDGSQSLESKPFEYKILEYTKNHIKIIHNSDAGKPIIYDRKEKSDNYNGEL